MLCEPTPRRTRRERTELPPRGCGRAIEPSNNLPHLAEHRAGEILGEILLDDRVGASEHLSTRERNLTAESDLNLIALWRSVRIISRVALSYFCHLDHKELFVEDDTALEAPHPRDAPVHRVGRARILRRRRKRHAPRTLVHHDGHWLRYRRSWLGLGGLSGWLCLRRRGALGALSALGALFQPAPLKPRMGSVGPVLHPQPCCEAREPYLL